MSPRIIEGPKSIFRTATIRIDLSRIPRIPPQAQPKEGGSRLFEIPVTQAVVYGWYDNERGNYTNVLGDMTAKIARSLSWTALSLDPSLHPPARLERRICRRTHLRLK